VNGSGAATMTNEEDREEAPMILHNEEDLRDAPIKRNQVRRRRWLAHRERRFGGGAVTVRRRSAGRGGAPTIQ
jgi:hypothetical protein